MDLILEKPVIVFYKERKSREKNAFLVVKAKQLSISKNKVGNKLKGDLKDFFPLMGDIDYISSKEGISDKYVLCWFDDHEDDFSKAWRRLNNVEFSKGTFCNIGKNEKRVYNAQFEAEYAKLE